MRRVFRGGDRADPPAGARQLAVCLGLFACGQLDKIPAGIVQDRSHHRSHIQGILSELHAQCLQAIELCADVVDREEVAGIPSATRASL